MRIGIDFDNTIICYDQSFCDLAKQWELVPSDYQGNKLALRDRVWSMEDGDTHWQRMQGQVYGPLISQAQLFAGFKEFVKHCNEANVELFIVSHKTMHGHFDESKTNLRDAANKWLTEQGFFGNEAPFISKDNVFYETTREEKIARIRDLNCSHFIDDLVEVLDSPSFPTEIKKILFQPEANNSQQPHLILCSNWIDVKNAIFQQ